MKNAQIARMVSKLDAMSMDALEQALDELHAMSIADAEHVLRLSSGAEITRAQKIVNRIVRTC